MISILKAAFVPVRPTKHELDARAAQTYAARTYAELAALTADLPADLADALPPRPAAQARARQPMSNAARARLLVAIAVAVPVVLSFSTGSAVLFLLFTPFYFTALAFLGAETLVSWREKPSHHRQLPPGSAPGPGRTASQRLPSAGPFGQLPPAGHGRRHTAEAARRRLPLPVHGHCAGGAFAAGTAPASG